MRRHGEAHRRSLMPARENALRIAAESHYFTGGTKPAVEWSADYEYYVAARRHGDVLNTFEMQTPKVDSNEA